MKKVYDFGFCVIEVYDDYIKNTVKEGVILQPEHNNILLDIVKEHFNNKPFVYITHRIHSYSVNPVIYLETSKIQNLAGIAVVSKRNQQKNLVKLEKIFLKKEFNIFDTMEEAITWKDQILEKQTDS
ncbi:hypothetical protein GTQ40_02855 [Flavobacteriaceae bacterium R38]|nr:hypothetical protein [Flavobacteriaceae bacterium R38]